MILGNTYSKLINQLAFMLASYKNHKLQTVTYHGQLETIGFELYNYNYYFNVNTKKAYKMERYNFNYYEPIRISLKQFYKRLIEFYQKTDLS